MENTLEIKGSKLAEALAKAQSIISVPAKKRTVDFIDNKNRRVHYKYADLADVIDCIRKPLSENNLALVHRLGYSPNGIYGMTTELLHLSGETISTWYPLPDPEKTQIRAQEFGSALTYARRYSLSALIGIASEEDDDGADAAPTDKPHKNPAKKPETMAAKPASKAPVKSAVKPPVANGAAPGVTKGTVLTEAQLKRLFTIAGAATWTNDQVRLYLEARYKIASTRELTRAQYDEFCLTMQEKLYLTACRTIPFDEPSRSDEDRPPLQEPEYPFDQTTYDPNFDARGPE